MRRHAFTLIETLLVVLILAISATVCIDALADTEVTFRAERAAREAVTAIRYARMLSVSSTGTYGIEFNQTAGAFQVFQTTGANVVPQPMNAGGTYVISLARRDLLGVSMTVTLTGSTANPFDVAYTNGNTSNTGTIVFACAGARKTITLPAVGDPTLQ